MEITQRALPGLSTQPVDEVRSACLQVPGENEPVQLFYRHEYATGAVDVIAITNR